MTGTSLIVARLRSDRIQDVSRLFAASDASELPHVLGVRRRRLYLYQDLYFHLVEFAGEPQDALARAADRTDFRRLSDELAEHVVPYDPQTWRSPADALAHEFYSWHSAGDEVGR